MENRKKYLVSYELELEIEAEDEQQAEYLASEIMKSIYVVPNVKEIK